MKHISKWIAFVVLMAATASDLTLVVKAHEVR